MRSRSATTRLMVDSFQVLHETVGVLSDTEKGAAMLASGQTSRRVALSIMRVAIFRLKLVRIPLKLVSKIKASVM